MDNRRFVKTGTGLALDTCQAVGHSILHFLQTIGALVMFCASVIKHIATPPWYPRLLVRQFIDIGYYSLPVVGMTAIFTGMVLALQSYTGFTRFNAESAIAGVVALSVTRELAPVLAGLMVAGRIGASIAAEIGTMRVTEQIGRADHPFGQSLQISDCAACGCRNADAPCACFDCRYHRHIRRFHRINIHAGVFRRQLFKPDMGYFADKRCRTGLWKAAMFGFIVTMMGCYHGFNSDRGAQGVGAATTHAVVSASILILVFNFILTKVFFS